MILIITAILTTSSIIHLIVTYRTGQWNALTTQNTNMQLLLENKQLQKKIDTLNFELHYLAKNKYKAYVISEHGIQVLPDNWANILQTSHLKENSKIEDNN